MSAASNLFHDRLLRDCSEDAKKNLSSPSYEDGLFGSERKFRILPECSLAMGLVQAMNTVTAVVLKSSVRTIIAKCTDDVEIQTQVKTDHLLDHTYL